MMKSKWPILLMLASGACTGSDLPLDDELEVTGPNVVAQHLVWVNHGGSSVAWVDPTGAVPPRAINVAESIRGVAFGPTQVLVLGRRASLPVVEVVDIPTGDRATIELPSLFERGFVSASGRFAILLHDARQTSSSPIAAQNHNEIVVVDLERAVATRVSLDTESTSPRNVLFSPDDLRAAVVLDAAVVVIELGDVERRVKVPLKLPGGGRLTPEQVAFAPDGRHVFIRATGTPDVVALALLESNGTLSGSLNFLAAPGADRLLDIAVPGADRYAGQVIAVFRRADGGSIAASIDADGDVSKTMLVELKGPASRVEVLADETVLLHGCPDLLGGVGNAYVAGWDPVDGRIEEDSLAGPAMGPPAVGTDAAFFLHVAEGGTATALTALAIRRSDARLGVALRPLVLGGAVKGYAYANAERRVVLGVDVQRKDSGAAPKLDGYGDEFAGTTGALAVIDPEGLEISSVALDANVVEVGVIGDYYYAIHESRLGDVTFVPRNTFERTAAVRYDGVLLTGILDQGENR